jgi:hypothetical protein
MSGYILSPQELQMRWGTRANGHPVYTRSMYEELFSQRRGEGRTLPDYWEWVSQLTKHQFLDPSNGIGPQY